MKNEVVDDMSLHHTHTFCFSCILSWQDANKEVRLSYVYSRHNVWDSASHLLAVKYKTINELRSETKMALTYVQVTARTRKPRENGGMCSE